MGKYGLGEIQLGDGTNMDSSTPVQVSAATGFTNGTAIAGGTGHSLAIDPNGQVWAWGNNNDGQLGNGANAASNTPVQVSVATGLTNVIAIACGGAHSLAISKSTISSRPSREIPIQITPFYF